MKIFDSVKKKKVDFVPIKEGEVRIYVCGPTVYDDAHLGHARSSITFDLLRRVFIQNGYKVTFVKNFTDIDDKIIDKMSNTGRSMLDITQEYTQKYKDDMHSMSVLDADIEPKATDNITAMSAMVDRLLKEQKAYIIDNDGVYFDTSKDNKYLSISNNIVAQESVQNRIGQNMAKKDFKDFALWKFSLIEPKYEASFGAGRPGWHIECSAMIQKHLAYEDEEYSIDIHGGGADLLFPHHENEAAQSRCSNDKELAKYWMHNGFVNIDGQKMSKSLGNSFFIKDALKSYSGEVLRFYLLSTHYRSNFNFNEEDLISSKKRLDKLYRLKKRVYGVVKSTQDIEFEDRIREVLSDDINISMALSVVDEFVSYANEALDNNPKDKIIKAKINSNLEFLDKVIGVGGSDSFEYFQFGLNPKTKEKIENLIKQRVEAKKAKDFEKSDKIRDEIIALGVSIMDTANGTMWEIV